MLLDEPSLGLAPKLVAEMFRLIREINASGVTILLVEQNARQALRISSRAYVLEKGRVSASGIASSLASDPAVVASYLGT
jgi:branched-chain amino acid transport system ATP-binding protein